MKTKFNLIVIGTGSAGSAAASICRKAGWNVAIIDYRPFGGTCALRGCDPKKVLVGAAEVVDWARRMQPNGVTSQAAIDWPALMNFKRSFTSGVPESREKSMKESGIKTYHGTAEFVNENTIRINNDELSSDYILLANGAKPVDLKIMGEQYLTHSDEFLELNSLPDEITFIGGCYISFEFAHIASRAGAKVRILHKGSRPLEGFDPDIVDILIEQTKELGIELILNAEATEIKKMSNYLEVHAEQNGENKTFKTKLVVHGAGRVPDLDEMMLEKANVKRDKKGVLVNDYLQSISNNKIYAAGDAAQSKGLPLTPVASMEGQIAAKNILEGNKTKPDYSVIPTVVFTIPPMASVGLSEKEAIAQKIKYDKKFEKTETWYGSRRIAEKHSAFKVLKEEKSGRILGAHLLGHNSEEIINLFAMAIKFKITADELNSMLYSYPSHSYSIHYMI